METYANRGQSFLLQTQRADGSWPYHAGGAGYPEPTCYALLALPEAEVSARERGLVWMEQRSAVTGAVTLENDPAPHWTTSLALFTFAELAAPEAWCTRCAEFLLSWEGVRVDPDPAIPLDPRLRGWPWTEGAFSWVEPTSYALLALKRAGYGTHSRVAEGERLLLDRICGGGGWNYGNREVLGRSLEPMLDTTAWALLALQGGAGVAAAVAEGLAILERQVTQYPATLTLSLAILAGEVWEQPVEEWVSLLRRRQRIDGSWRGEVHLTALALLAMCAAEGEGNVFRL